jgi:hypothetical protein
MKVQEAPAMAKARLLALFITCHFTSASLFCQRSRAFAILFRESKVQNCLCCLAAPARTLWLHHTAQEIGFKTQCCYQMRGVRCIAWVHQGRRCSGWIVGSLRLGPLRQECRTSRVGDSIG